MKSEIICVGTELLLGDVVNTNAAFISQELAELGIDCYYHTVVGDNPKRLEAVLKFALERSDIIFITGGLGPTYDDLTKEVVAKALGLELEYDEKLYSRIEAAFKITNRTLTENNKKQAWVPQGAYLVENYNGTAPGLIIEKSSKYVVMMPGVPHEMKSMFKKSIKPFLLTKQDKVLVSHRVYLFGIGESRVEEILKDKMVSYTNPTIAPYASIDGVEIRVSAQAHDVETANRLIMPVIDEIVNIFEMYVYGIDVINLEHALLELLHQREMNITIFETETYGSLTQRIGRYDSMHNTVIDSTAFKSRKQIISQFEFKNMTLQEETKKIVEQYQIDDVPCIVIHSNLKNELEKKGEFCIGIMIDRVYHTKTIQLWKGYDDDEIRIRYQATSYTLKFLIDILRGDYHEEIS